MQTDNPARRARTTDRLCAMLCGLALHACYAGPDVRSGEDAAPQLEPLAPSLCRGLDERDTLVSLYWEDLNATPTRLAAASPALAIAAGSEDDPELAPTATPSSTPAVVVNDSDQAVDVTVSVHLDADEHHPTHFVAQLRLQPSEVRRLQVDLRPTSSFDLTSLLYSARAALHADVVAAGRIDSVRSETVAFHAAGSELFVYDEATLRAVYGFGDFRNRARDFEPPVFEEPGELAGIFGVRREGSFAQATNDDGNDRDRR